MFDWTTYSKLACLQINVDTILFSDRQFDSFFDTTHTVIGVHTKMHNSLTHQSQSPSNPQKEFLIKFTYRGKLRGLFVFHTSQHYFTENRLRKRGKNLSDTSKVCFKLHINLVPHSLQRTFEQFSYLYLKIIGLKECRKMPIKQKSI